MKLVVVGLFNRGTSPSPISFRWDSLDLKAGLGGKMLIARDLWRHEPITVTGITYTATVPLTESSLSESLLIQLRDSPEAW